MSAHRSVHMPTHMSTHMSMHMSMHVSNHMSMHMSMHMAAHIVWTHCLHTGSYSTCFKTYSCMLPRAQSTPSRHSVRTNIYKSSWHISHRALSTRSRHIRYRSISVVMRHYFETTECTEQACS